ncbi:peptidyl-tRNA hydrolase [Litchfieldella anticariensis FP35 = DSM 16096]|uniref:Peptidyl-tRNA hydrolase n=1 Tax=Litchfieldella anticariensis (strain DSM 16096 / CECT 5854 / CIP 108499 / LMG 22089 / FP35) TaxID=1121939 RepID=S2KTA9_LITA3|nr:aminoacyl-tRNA hydrolase [Halomonas anticariensis]EPC03763.1 peptidyl-tRNA hydrolase [Halomonas anticariensis FP35 = DSM 16096]
MSHVKAIIGLGNPGPEYDDTRHNAGAWLVEAIARDSHTPLRPERKFLGHYAKVNVAGEDLHLLLPQTFMNRSGGAVAALCQFFKLAPSELLVAHDELDIAPGTARYKQGGGHGGHNGLRDIIRALGNDNSFHRLRIGIGHPGDSRQVTNYVLGRPGKAERAAIEAVFGEIEATLPDAIRGNWAKAMNRLHSFKE